MDKINKYKEMYPAIDGNNELVIEASGKVHIPIWLTKLLIDTSGLKSKKKRIIKKVLKRNLIKLIENQTDTNEQQQTTD